MKRKVLGIYKFLLALVSAGLIIIAGCERREKDLVKVVIRYVNFEGLPEQRVLMERIINDFELEHPAIKIRYEFAPSTIKVLTELAGRSGPDVFYWPEGGMPVLVEKGVVLDLSPLIQKSIVDLSDYYPQTIEAFRYDKGIYALPLHFSNNALYYNKNLFDEAGISYPDKSWTWDDFLEAAKKLTKDNDGDRRIDQFGCNRPDYETMIESNGGKIFSDDYSQCLLNSPEAIQSIQFIINLDKEYKVIPSAGVVSELHAGRETISLFMSGKLGMVDGRTWMLSEFSKIKNFEWDVALLPRGKSGRSSSMGAGGLCISKESKYPSDAFEFIHYYCGKQGSKVLAKYRNCTPAFWKVAEEIFADPPPSNIRVFIDSVRYSKPVPKLAVYGEIGPKVIYSEMESIYLGNVSPHEGLTHITIGVNHLLEESKKK